MPALRIEVFRRSGDDLVAIAPPDWEAFCAGQAPLPAPEAARRKVDLLLVTSRDGLCELIEPISVHVDGCGYLQRLHVRLDTLPSETNVRDARHAFLGRYLRHANHWSVTETHIAQALAHLGAARR
jgi:hypothetical protein